MSRDYEALYEAIAALPKVDGVLPMDVLTLPEAVGRLVRRLIRAGSLTLTELAAELNLEPEQARQVGELLAQKGYLLSEIPSAESPPTFRIYLARMRKRNLSLDL